MRTDSRLALYGKEIATLGFANWVLYRIQRIRARFASDDALLPLRVRGMRHPLYFRAKSSDLLVFWQIIIANEYRCLDDVQDADLVIDCGANVGYSAAFFAARHPRARIIAVEPDPRNFAVLEKNMAPYADRCDLLRTGVWSRPTGLVFVEDATTGWAVSVREAAPGEKAALQATDIATLIERSGRSRVSILKIDIEGSERHVFAQKPSWIDRVDNMVIELHGPECDQACYGALSGESFETSTCDELHVFKRPQQPRRAAMGAMAGSGIAAAGA